LATESIISGNARQTAHTMNSVANSPFLAYNSTFADHRQGNGVGSFITFEGIEGCGKSTQIRLLAESLTSGGHCVTLTREPGGCAIADKIRGILLDADNRAMLPLAELLLYAAARAQHVGEVVKPALDQGNVVLCDRFTDATIAYQSNGRGICRDTVASLNSLACQGATPDLTVLIDCAPELGLERARRRIDSTSGPREERFELEALAFHQRVREGYLSLAAAEPRRFLIIDGSDTVERTANTIARQVATRLEELSHAVR